MAQITTTFDKFDGYEISHVVEYQTPGESLRYCEPLIGSTMEDERANPRYVSDFWTLYGHMPAGGVVAIGDFSNEAQAEEILALIGGTRTGLSQ